MSRFFKSAAFPILIVVVLVLLAVGFSTLMATRTPRPIGQRPSSPSIPKPGVAEARQILGR